STGLFALPLALSMEAHYRELKLSGKPIFAKSGNKSSKIGLSLVIHSQPQLLYRLTHKADLSLEHVGSVPCIDLCILLVRTSLHQVNEGSPR
ncbi:hypothetical protein ACLHZY_06440, partial [Aeromonas media]